MTIADDMMKLGKAARCAASNMAAATSTDKSKALIAIAHALDDARGDLRDANAKDLASSKAKGLEQPLLDRLLMDDVVIDRMIEGVRQVDALPDPIGQIDSLKLRPSGIRLGRMSVPLGVVGIIYESRPNVTIDASILCLKTGNAAILRGGSEAIESNLALAKCIHAGLKAAALPETAVQIVATTDRAAVGAMIAMSEYIDILIPRGGRSLIERISKDSNIPVIKHLDGVCHLYIDDSADIDQAQAIAFNSKAEKLAVCNAIETLLIAKDIAAAVLPALAERFLQHGIELRGCEQSLALVPTINPAQSADWSTEYLGPVLAVRVVEDIDAAIRHINRYGSMHTDAIVCERQDRAWRFLKEVDSASVIVNASTQFADGMEFGLGAEIGISTGKLHARGPVGLEGLCSRKFVVFGQGEIRDRSVGG